MEEEWRDIPDWPYEASNLGRVRRVAGGWTKKSRVLKFSGTRGTIGLQDKPRLKYVTVAHCVLLAFVGPPPEGKTYALHKDDNPKNNVPSNLYWGSNLENHLDAVKNGRHTEESEKRKAATQFKKGQEAWNKGISPSEEIRERISKTLTGRKKPEEVAKRQAETLKLTWARRKGKRIKLPPGF